jgi:hypothetical protein
MSNEGKRRRDVGIARVVDNEKAEYKAHYHQTMAAFFATIRVGGTFMIEEGHAKLTMKPHHPNAKGGLSNGFINPKLQDGSVIEVLGTASEKPTNNGTYARVYQRIR